MSLPKGLAILIAAGFPGAFLLADVASHLPRDIDALSLRGQRGKGKYETAQQRATFLQLLALATATSTSHAVADVPLRDPELPHFHQNLQPQLQTQQQPQSLSTSANNPGSTPVGRQLRRTSKGSTKKNRAKAERKKAWISQSAGEDADSLFSHSSPKPTTGTTRRDKHIQKQGPYDDHTVLWSTTTEGIKEEEQVWAVKDNPKDSIKEDITAHANSSPGLTSPGAHEWKRETYWRGHGLQLYDGERYNGERYERRRSGLYTSTSFKKIKPKNNNDAIRPIDTHLLGNKEQEVVDVSLPSASDMVMAKQEKTTTTDFSIPRQGHGTTAMVKAGKPYRALTELQNRVRGDWLADLALALGQVVDVDSVGDAKNYWVKLDAQGWEVSPKLLDLLQALGMLQHSSEESPVLRLTVKESKMALGRHVQSQREAEAQSFLTNAQVEELIRSLVNQGTLVESQMERGLFLLARAGAANAEAFVASRSPSQSWEHDTDVADPYENRISEKEGSSTSFNLAIGHATTTNDDLEDAETERVIWEFWKEVIEFISYARRTSRLSDEDLNDERRMFGNFQRFIKESSKLTNERKNRLEHEIAVSKMQLQKYWDLTSDSQQHHRQQPNVVDSLLVGPVVLKK